MGMVVSRGAYVFQKSRSYLKLLGARRLTLIKVHPEDTEILGATVQNVFAFVCTSRVFNLEGFVNSFTKR